jgi:DNA-binding winged helix-turn-helix (wHTH) protein
VQDLVLDDGNLTITVNGKSTPLLPKEFALLRYLYAHPNRTFSREELLDAVWPLEHPVDRTVDDHVYRLRKKLSRIPGNPLVLETVRGRGYRLCPTPPSITRAPEPPILQPTIYRQHIRYLFNTYVRNGYGQGLMDLQANAETFGIHTDPTLGIRSKFFAGDFQGIVEDTTFRFEDKAFCLLSLYSCMQFDYEKTLNFCHRAIDQYVLPTESHLEILCIHIPINSYRAGYKNEAQLALNDGLTMALTYPLDGFIPLLRLEDSLFSLYEGKTVEAEHKLMEASRILLAGPWNRELAFYEILKGLLALAKGRPSEAESSIDSGLGMLREINIANHVLLRVHDVLYFLRHCVSNEALLAKYEHVWGELSRMYDFASLEPAVYRILSHHLL